MKVLITKQFNESMQRLDQNDRNEVVSMFGLVSNMTKEALMSSPMLIKLQSEDLLYTLRTKNTRIFCSLNEEDLFFLDVKETKDRHLSSGITWGQENKNEVTLFGRLGDPQAYLAPDAIYSFDGLPLAYLDGTNIYGFNGKHLGWFENGIVWDHNGHRAGFTKQTCPTFTQFEPFKGFKQFKPFKAFKAFAPFKPFMGYTISGIPLLKLLEQGRS